MLRSARPTTLALAALLLTGCFTTTADFRSDAEDFIRTNDELRAALETSFPTATCEEPANRDTGTTFPCTAVDDQDRTWEFEIVIVDDNEYQVNVSRYP